MTKELFRDKKEIPNGAQTNGQPLVSVILISYNNVQFLWQAVKSVLTQTYGNYELTISDDASIGCTIEDCAYHLCLAAAESVFERNHLEFTGTDRKWKPHEMEEEARKVYLKELENWGRENFGNYCSAAEEIIHHFFPACKTLNFRRNAENLGTVKHLKTLKQNAAGKYIMFLAADDMLHDRYVISDMIEHFEALPEDAFVLSSQCGMYDEKLQQLYYYAVTDELRPILMDGTPERLFAELADWCIIPAAGTIYKKQAFEKFGDLDNKYHLIEDWTFFLRLTRMGGRVYYYDRLTYKHRDGGISHGNTAAGKLARKYYLEDCILLTREEIIPYFDQIPPKQRKKCKRRYRATCREYEKNYVYENLSIFQKISFFARYGDYYFPKVLFAALAYFEYRSKWMFSMGLVLLLGSALISGADVPGGYSPFFYMASGLIGMLLFLAGIMSKLMYKIAVGFRNMRKRLLQRGI